MRLVGTYPGGFEVYSNGYENPWYVHKGGAPLATVWTWKEVAALVGAS